MRALFLLLTIVAIAAIPAAAQQSSPKTEKPAAAQKAEKPAPAGPLVNLNTATQAQLETLPGVGAKAAERILEYRQKNGQFKKIEDIRQLGAFMCPVGDPVHQPRSRGQVGRSNRGGAEVPGKRAGRREPEDDQC